MLDTTLAQAPAILATPATILKTLHPGHPRLLATAQDFAALKKKVASDALLFAWHLELKNSGQAILAQAPSQYEIPDGKRLLATSRRVLDRTTTLAMLYQLDGDRRWVDRAWAELDGAAQFKDWNPAHFLDTAEMTAAFAIGYDWLYDAWTAEQRQVLRQAIIRHGLTPALASYDGKEKYGWWVTAEHNWNQVCNGGIGCGALAIADEEPALAGRIVHEVVTRLPIAMQHFAPDGAWAEGPGYWHYAMKYNVLVLAAMQTSLGKDFGLSEIAGFNQAGWFPIHLVGPLNKSFNFADAKEGGVHAPEWFWLARRFDEPAFARHRLRQLPGPSAGKSVSKVSPLDLLWFAAFSESIDAPAAPLDRCFRGVEVATMRSAWGDRAALYVGFKAGDNAVNHSNLDLGTFVLDALGRRWATDLGPDNYNLPAYFSKTTRWTYYRMRAEGHNVVVVNPGHGPDQDPKAATKIVKFESKPGRALAVADLTAANAEAASMKRGVAMLNRQQVLVQDEVRFKAAGDVWWFMHTQAKVTLADDGRGATLAFGGDEARLDVRLLSPSGAKFQVMDAAPLSGSPNPAGQADNKGTRKLAIHLAGVDAATIAVVMTPYQMGEGVKVEAVEVVGLEGW
ncbi:MAG: heparinase II/III family protein [Phycisphaeraceae bacterium]